MGRTLLLEIGCEELPTSFVRAGMEQLAKLAVDELVRVRIHHGGVRALGTPRRLALLVSDVEESIAARTEELMGPAESAAKGANGAWTKAAEGFARRNELPLDALTVIDTPKGRYVRAEKTHAGAVTRPLLPAVLDAVIAKIAFPKSMRWADVETPFGRPVQWLVALYGDEVIETHFAGLTSARTTYGHRFLAPQAIELRDAASYVETLRTAHVQVDEDERRAEQLKVLLAAADGERGTLVRNDFLEGEVLGLVEEPHAVVGRFDRDFLALPDALIETVMSHHQRYFAARNADGTLLPVFITTVNTALDPATIRKGNERVMRARLSDARFFVQQDEHTTLESRIAKLDGVVYHQKLGTYGDKVRRIEQLAAVLAPAFGVDVELAARAARLAKADLVSLAVGEFPELQGTMGAHYAKHDGESPDVVRAIGEHYQPRTADDDVAGSRPGAVVALADRIDTLVGFFGIGQKPSSAGDPFGLRRASFGLIRTLVHHRAHLSLATMFGRAFTLYERPLPAGIDATGQELAAFVRERLESTLAQRFPNDLVIAALAAGHDDPVDALERVEALAAFAKTPDLVRVIVASERVFNISTKAPPGEADASLLTLPAEVALREAFGAMLPAWSQMFAARDYAGALALVATTLPAPVDRFFTEVFVMDENASVRTARLQFLRRIADEIGTLARFDKLSAASYERAAVA